MRGNTPRLQLPDWYTWKGTKLRFSTIKDLDLEFLKPVHLGEKAEYLSMSVNVAFLILDYFWCCNILVLVKVLVALF